MHLKYDMEAYHKHTGTYHFSKNYFYKVIINSVVTMRGNLYLYTHTF